MSLKIAINHLLENCYFNIGSVIVTQSIDISMGIDPPTLFKSFCAFLERRIHIATNLFW